MREGDFTAAVRRLFERLGLGEPRFDGTGIVRLRIEAVGVNLTDGGNGRMLIEAQAGPLPPDGPARAGAVAEVLRTAAGLLLDSEAGTYLRAFPGGQDMVLVQASHPCRSGDLDRLATRIEDVVHLAELHGASLASGASAKAAPRPAKPAAPGIDDMLIFRP
ncbi:type III secretion system chaperone [Aureimonas leprariae]|uniref:Type III secretion system chaperone n=1 Tax=Plantimonas leprariae TaxID=2615207 RepID=A0A7V7TY95_9HYPH|nr:type III secretion system chaperone [Aureimonas leprariae]KAB0676862.1 type III secretion system chaperone [Aureimonas leprariae]